MENNIIKNLEKGTTRNLTTSDCNTEKIWIPHPSFKGVFLKHIITGAQTDNTFSSHIVKIEPNCVLDKHIHEGKTELHEVISGSGFCILEDNEFAYASGDCTIIPNDKNHKVVASEQGLVILAKFFPALL